MSDYHLGPIVICEMEINIKKEKITYWINEFMGEIIKEHVFKIPLCQGLFWNILKDNNAFENMKKWVGIND